MFVDELNKIKESENKADQLQKKAKVDSKQNLENANSEAGRIFEEAQNKAKEAYDILINEGQAISDKEYEEYLAQIKTECVDMIEKAKNNEDKAVEFIAERIVSASVNN